MKREALLSLEKTTFAYGRTVRFQDIDAAGIIFFARYFEYFHDAYVRFLDDTDAALPAALSSRSWAAPLVHAEADFVKPLAFGDSVEVELAAVDVGDKRATLYFRVWRDGDVVAFGSTVHVAIDPRVFKSTPIPEALRAALLRLPAAP